MKASELIERLQRHYIKPGEALPGGMFLPEVTHTGYNGRRADALYVGFTRSRGLHLIGHELKVARSDWLHELEQLEKAETWASQCHGWYLVVPDTSIARAEELPHGWGLMTVDPRTKTRLRVEVRATIDETRHPDWVTVHSILKRADTLRAAAIADARKKIMSDTLDERLRLEAELNRLRAAGPERLQAELDQANAALAELCQILGIERIAGTAAHPSHFAGNRATSIDDIRTAFAAYLRADRDVDKALAWKLDGVDAAMRSITHAHDALAAASKVLERHELKERS